MWRVVFGSVQGTSHEGAGLPCQDSSRADIIEVDGSQVLVACCSDGAGSASHSEVGSAIACDILARLATEHLQREKAACTITESVAVGWYREIRAAICVRAGEDGVPLREFACTLLCAIVSPDHAFFCQLGDGAIVVQPPDEGRAVFWPQSGEYANTTCFITGDEAMESLLCESYLGDVSSLAIFTDGLERLILKFKERAVHIPFLTPMFKQIRASEDIAALSPQLRAFLNSPAINARTDDDKTLILATRALPNESPI